MVQYPITLSEGTRSFTLFWPWIQLVYTATCIPDPPTAASSVSPSCSWLWSPFRRMIPLPRQTLPLLASGLPGPPRRLPRTHPPKRSTLLAPPALERWSCGGFHRAVTPWGLPGGNAASLPGPFGSAKRKSPVRSGRQFGPGPWKMDTPIRRQTRGSNARGLACTERLWAVRPGRGRLGMVLGFRCASGRGEGAWHPRPKRSCLR
jgi:hypothetical protein